MNSTMPAAQAVYEADASMMQTVQYCRERIHHVCKQYMNHRVQVRTVQGQIYEGTLSGFDELHLYLDTSMPTYGNRQFFPGPYPTPYLPYNPYYSTILPLVLFDLLAITLLY